MTTKKKFPLTPGDRSDLAAHLRQGSVLIWEAFKTYFTVSTLLLTAFAFLQSMSAGDTPISIAARHNLSIGIASIGVLVTLGAVLAIRRFITYLKAFVDLGDSADPAWPLGEKTARVFTRSTASMPILTWTVYLAFLLLWLAVLVYLWPPLR